ncbi:MAG: hypothetical protein E7183_02405 [Erysipelotrichaceae bacterium]|nr:hypothetical protein [Erysipelotrichaceae bacterium]
MKTLKVLCIMLCLALTLTVTSCEKEDKIMENYPGITDNKHIIRELSLKELTEKISNQETFVVVLGFPECPWCQALMPEVNEVGKNLDLDEAYYCNIKDARDNPESKDKIYYLGLYEYFKECVDTEKNRINAPTTIKVNSGKLAGYHIDTVPTHTISETGVLPPLTEDEKLELHTLLKELFNK